VIVNGWRIFFHPIIADRFRLLRAEAERLKRSLPDDQYRAHPRVRLLASVVRIVREIAPENPNAPDFQLRDDLAKFRRAKDRGLPERYRLFWVFSSQSKTIIYLYLNDQDTLRKAGGKNGPYEVFKKLIRQGKIGTDFAVNRQMIDEESRAQNPPESPPGTG